MSVALVLRSSRGRGGRDLEMGERAVGGRGGGCIWGDWVGLG